MSDQKNGSSKKLTKNRNNKISPVAAKWLGWGFVGLVIFETVWGISDSIRHTTGHTNPIVILGMILFGLFPLTFAVLAALVITRQPGNILGWLMTLPVLSGILSTVSEAYLQKVIVPTPSLPILLMVWLDSISWTLFVFPTLLILVLFPTGRPPSRNWNWVVIYAVVMLIFFDTLAGLSQIFTPSNATWEVANPIGFIPITFFDKVFSLPWTIALGLLTLFSVTALFVRYRQGTSVEKAQLKWLLYASALFGLVYIMNFPLSDFDANTPIAILLNFLFSLTALTIPVAIGIAILRYRLWDIDFVINRSLVYGALTALLVMFLGGSLFIVSQLFQNLTGGPLVAVAVSATIFGAIFQPTRRHIQRFVDQRFYHINIDYQKTQPGLEINSMTQALRETQFGVYQNLELIGRGGMAEVYKSTHPTLHKSVAIKILPNHLATEADFRKRFTREAQIVSKLEHPNIVRMFDSGENNGRHYMVMEYLTGKDLSEFIRANGKLSLSQTLPLIQQIASALDYAHTQGLVHRDIKPSNVLLDTTSTNNIRAILTDFGIAKIIHAHTAMTKTGGMLGTFDYMAPEQIQESTNVDGRADVYALGVMVYQMLTGNVPFKHNNPGALLIAHLTQPPPDACNELPDLPEQVCDAIQRAMAKKPDERFATASEFATALNTRH